MTDAVTFRTTDSLRWGPGQGSNLTATEIDINFWVLLSAVQSLQAAANTNAGIDHLVIANNQLFVHLTNHFVLGPYTLPVAQWNFRGDWRPSTAYDAFDVVTDSRSVYLVLLAHVSNSLFSPNASDGIGHNWYGLLLQAAPPELPQTGVHGQVLQWQTSPGDVRWFTQTRNIGLYLETPPDPIEYVVEYAFTESTLFPAGLVQSQFSVGTRPTGDQEFDLFMDGGPIGSVTFHPTGPATIVFLADTTFAAGQVLSVKGPSVPDVHMTRIRMNFVGVLGS